MRARAVPIKAVRFEVAADLAKRIRERLGESSLNEWAKNALAAGLSVPAERLRGFVQLGGRARDRESLFLELPPAFLERVDSRAVHVNLKRTAFARACFALALDGNL